MARPSQTSASARPRRTPIGQRNVLNVQGKEDGYVYRIVNDTGDRIQQFLDAGYELVDANSVRVGDKRVNQSTPEGTKAQVSVGGGQKAFVMRIPKEYYEEDQAAKQAEVNRLEESIKKQVSSGNADYGKVMISQG